MKFIHGCNEEVLNKPLESEISSNMILTQKPNEMKKRGRKNGSRTELWYSMSCCEKSDSILSYCYYGIISWIRKPYILPGNIIYSVCEISAKLPDNNHAVDSYPANLTE